MHHFHTLKISKLVREIADCVSLEFDIPDELKESFAYKQGQHVAMKKTIGGTEVRRTYSICTSPAEQKLKVAIKKVEGGAFSTFANENLAEGQVLDVMPPSGNFYTDLSPKQAKNYVGFAGGSGITPIISILKAVLQTESNSTFTLIYGNRGMDSIVFKEEIEGLKNKYLDRLTIYHVFSDEVQEFPLFNGFIDKDKVKAFSETFLNVDEIDEYFICGPEPMMLQIKDGLGDLKVDENKVHIELFTSPVGKLGEQARKKKESHEKIKSKITIQLDGNQFEFNYNGSDSILDAAAKKGADLPYACKGGVCCTCKARLLEGEVDMDVNYALEPDELEKGYILTCQSHPKSETLKITFDEN